MDLDRRIVIGLTGPFGAGCTTIADDLCNQEEFRKYSLSDVMRGLAPSFIPDLDKDKLRSPEHRWYQQYVGNEIRKEELYAIPHELVEIVRQDEERNNSLKSQQIVIDGIRNPSEITYLRNEYSNFFVIAVFAPADVRWKRKRDIYGFREDSFERDDTQDSGETEPATGQKVQLCVDRSDILIGNERPFDEPRVKEELQSKIDGYIKLMNNPGRREPHPWELSMGQAYQASLMSSCCKRRVGAIVVREEPSEKESRSYVIASGYNEAPLNIRRCIDRGGEARPEYCYKDEKVKEKLRKDYKYCPKCGAEVQIPEEFHLPLICPNDDCDARIGLDFIPGRMLDLCIAVHAEEAAILQASRFGGTEIDGSTLYTTTFPCPLCAKMIVQAGISRVVFAEPYPQDEATTFLEDANIGPELFEGVKGRAYHRLFEQLPYGPNGR